MKETISAKQDFPNLKRTLRDAEYKRYSDKQIQKVIVGYLFNNKSHRQLDDEVLGLDSKKSLGYKSMALLHHLGLVDSHKNIFRDYSLENAIHILIEKDCNQLASLLLMDSKIISNEESTDEELDNVVSVVGVEGKRIEYYTYKYERKPKLRKLAIRMHGCKCKTCGFDFEDAYGELGREFIEIHHIKPLYSLTEEAEVNPSTDLVPLCSNCHRMIHRSRSKIITVAELQKIIDVQK